MRKNLCRNCKHWSEAKLEANHDLTQVVRIECLNLSERAKNCLKILNVETILDISSYTINELLRIPGLGRTTVSEIEIELNKFGIRLDENRVEHFAECRRYGPERSPKGVPWWPQTMPTHWCGEWKQVIFED